MRGVKGEGVVYVTQSRKLKRFKGRPVKTTDPTVEEWIEDAKASSDSKGLTKEKTALSLLLGVKGEEIKSNPEQIYGVLLRVFGDGESLLSYSNSSSHTTNSVPWWSTKSLQQMRGQ